MERPNEMESYHGVSTDAKGLGLQAGLSALKTPQSLEGAGAREDPLHLPTFRKLAEDVPYSKHVHSKLVCAITTEPMNEHNHPMVTPAGAVYSERGVSEVTARNGGVFVCPHTGMQRITPTRALLVLVSMDCTAALSVVGAPPE